MESGTKAHDCPVLLLSGRSVNGAGTNNTTDM